MCIVLEMDAQEVDHGILAHNEGTPTSLPEGRECLKLEF